VKLKTLRNRYMPNYAIPPGDTLREVLEGRKMTQKELAAKLGMSHEHLNRIIRGIAPITLSTAWKLEIILGIPRTFWNNLEKNYRETKARLENEKRRS